MRNVIISTHQIYDRADVTDEYLNQLVLPNPAYSRYERQGYSTKGISPAIQLYKEKDGKVYVPRNIRPAPGPFNRIDKRVEGPKISYKCSINLREDQVPAVLALTNALDGILHAACGKGKTIMALKAIANVGRPALILVHKEFLMTQWKKNVKEWLGIEAGVVQGDNWTWQGNAIVIGMLQTLYARRDDLPSDFINHFGIIVSDEVHRVSAPTWSSVVELFPAKRRWGLSATLKRSDGLEVIFLSHIGAPVFHLLGTNLKPIVQPVLTGADIPMQMFEMRSGRLNTARLGTYLTQLEDRNKLILRLLISAAESGRRILLLTDRREHAESLRQWFDFNTKNKFESRVYIGGLTAADRAEAEDNADVLFATTQMAKEALDIPDLDTLFLVSPQGSEITTEQAVGRIARFSEGKKTPMVLDFVDEKSRYTAGLFYKRAKIYEQMKLEVRRATSGGKPKGTNQADSVKGSGDQSGTGSGKRERNGKWFAR